MLSAVRPARIVLESALTAPEAVAALRALLLELSEEAEKTTAPALSARFEFQPRPESPDVVYGFRLYVEVEPHGSGSRIVGTFSSSRGQAIGLLALGLVLGAVAIGDAGGGWWSFVLVAAGLGWLGFDFESEFRTEKELMWRRLATTLEADQKDSRARS